MTTKNWKEIAELIGIGGIIASLIFVGLQMRQSHEIALVTLYQMRADAAREVMVAGWQSDSLEDAFERMDTGGGEPTYSETNALYSYMTLLVNHFENSHFLYQRGFLTEEHWQSDVVNLTNVLSNPGAAEIWNEVKSIYRESYVQAIDEALEERRSSSQDDR